MYGLSVQSFIRVIDAKGKEASINFNHPLNVDLGALKTTLRSTAEMIDTIITGQVVGAGISLIVILDDALDLKSAAVPGADIEEGVRFLWETASGGQTSFRMPTVNETWITGMGILDFAPADLVDDFVQRIISGRTQGIINASPSDAYGSDITSLIGGTESFLASRG